MKYRECVLFTEATSMMRSKAATTCVELCVLELQYDFAGFEYLFLGLRFSCLELLSLFCNRHQRWTNRVKLSKCSQIFTISSFYSLISVFV